ncbi:hypothetical protein BRYFOR_08435 [Marvinbryantia formatexigens DSM 14469]|uniref:Uncharacterized protein n=1 Tax=Marvinbryantia formatexigens DSM 14469 TaxID=478749 RepID=C6LIJ7_9FIRM|nr:hypothetical protein BRYFOR_08435 [Marvinbryantia formatexigens DSM 14469]
MQQFDAQENKAVMRRKNFRIKVVRSACRASFLRRKCNFSLFFFRQVSYTII